MIQFWWSCKYIVSKYCVTNRYCLHFVSSLVQGHFPSLMDGMQIVSFLVKFLPDLIFKDPITNHSQCFFQEFKNLGFSDSITEFFNFVMDVLFCCCCLYEVPV